MEMIDLNSKIFLVPVLCLFLVSVGQTQLQFCNEMISPQKLFVDDSSAGLIRVPLRGNKYSRNQLCEWIIECKEGETIQLTVEMCSIEDRDILGECNKDYVNVFDHRGGELVLLARFCGTDRGMVYQSTGNKVTIIFVSDAVYEFQGFRLSYSAVSEGGSSHDIVVQLAVGIPVGILIILMVVPFTVVMCKVYRKRRLSHTTSYANTIHSGPPLASQGWNQEISNISDPSGNAPTTAATAGAGNRITGRGPPSWGSTRGQAYDPGLSQGYPLQVSLPEDQYGLEEDVTGGRSSPPPSYESLGYESHTMTPPAYESVLKTAQDDSRGDEHRH